MNCGKQRLDWLIIILTGDRTKPRKWYTKIDQQIKPLCYVLEAGSAS